jgi:lysophospholipase L1-like esterase
MLDAIRKHAPAAKLIWATTTSIRDDATDGPSDARIKDRNAIALKLMRANQIPVDDLYEVTVGHPELHLDNIHFNPQGTAVLSANVSAAIQKLLP